MTFIIYLCGFYCLVFAVFHIGFWKRFNWDKDLKKLLFANRGIMQILNVQIIYYFLAVAFLCFAFPYELQDTKLGNAFLLSCSLFWLIRTVQQFIFLKANSKLIHILTVIFIIGTILFALPVFQNVIDKQSN
jgi:phage shock protein PspC (stress-responsive transcriptional regulator)